MTQQDLSSGYQHFKNLVIATTGLTQDALHVYAGLAVLLLVAGAFRLPLRSVIPWFCVLLAALAAEMLDLRDDLASLGNWRWRESARDVANTLFWPTVLLLFTRRRVGSGTE